MSSLFDTGIRPLVDAHLLELSKQKRDYGEYWSASSAGYCMRRVIFERLGVPHVSEDARKQRVFTSGHLFHDWIQGITKKAGISIAQELELQDESLMIRGHIDDLVLIDGKLMLIDYKTVNSRSFMWAKKNNNAMSYFHKMQLGTYMYMLRQIMGDIENLPTSKLLKLGDQLKNLSEARILKIEKDSLMMGEQQLLWDDELEYAVVIYWTTLNEYWKARKLPPCTCADRENGFMAKPDWNPFYYKGEPCSVEWLKLHKEKENVTA